jgi:xylulokinase
LNTQNNKFYIGIDLGTTHMKSAVFNEHGNLVEILKTATPLSTDEFGQIYEPLVLYEVIRNQLSKLMKHYDNFGGISITGMSEAGLVINCSIRTEATPMIPWFDKRTVDLAGQLSKEEELENFYRTGLRNNYKYGIYKYLWLLQHYKLNKEDTLWLSACDYIVWKLTGQFASDPSFAARTYVYDINHHCWDEQRLLQYGLSGKNFPKIVPSGQCVGYLKDDELLAMTQNKNIMVCLGGHDHVCATYAVVGEDSNRVCNSIGTAETFIGISDHTILTEQDYHTGMVYGPYLDGKRHFWMGNISSSGQSIEWFRNKVQATPMDYSEITYLLTAMPDKPTNILYFPYLSGIGTPLFRPEVGGGFFGLRENHTRSDMLKGIIEGINYQGKWILSLLPEKEFNQICNITCVGGATNNDPWMQIKADVLGIPISVPDVTEATLLGTVAIMLNKNYDSKIKMKFLSKSEIKHRIYEVNQDNCNKYQETYTEFKTLLNKILN